LSFSKDILIYLGLILLAGLYKVAEFSFGSVPYLNSYFEDLMALPLLLKSSLLVVQYSNQLWSTLVLDKTEIIAITLIFSTYFEAILPYFDLRFTADPLDVPCYFIGAWFYSIFLNKSLVVN